MGKVYRSANGKSIDIDKLRLVNEDTIAVGNMKVNARGDQLGPGGTVIQSRNQAMDQHYKLHTPVAEDTPAHSVVQEQLNQGASVAQGKAQDIPNLDPSGESFDPPEVPQAPTTPPMRGSLADSIAKQVTVNQELLSPQPNKPKGPSRI